MKVVTFGELMIRLQPFNYERFVQANNLEFSFGGGEANVAVSLANYGLDAAFVTKLPPPPFFQTNIFADHKFRIVFIFWYKSKLVGIAVYYYPFIVI